MERLTKIAEEVIAWRALDQGGLISDIGYYRHGWSSGGLGLNKHVRSRQRLSSLN